jgi:hypothetical protein
MSVFEHVLWEYPIGRTSEWRNAIYDTTVL